MRVYKLCLLTYLLTYLLTFLPRSYTAGRALSQDGGRRTTLSTCGSGSRESVVFVSTGNDVIVQLLSADVLRRLAPFLVKYEGIDARRWCE